MNFGICNFFLGFDFKRVMIGSVIVVDKFY